MILRWLHEHVSRHHWEEVSHLHDIADGEQSIDCYRLDECRCGAVRESFIVKHELPSLFPGIEMGVAEVHIHDLNSLEDAKVWARP